MRIDPEDFRIGREPRIFDRSQVLSVLYKNSFSIEGYNNKKRIEKDKYIRLALERGYTNYKINNIAEVSELDLLFSLPKMIKDFMNRTGHFLMIFNLLSGVPVSVLFREIGGKEFFDFSIYPCFYGMDHISPEFKYGDALLITEGAYDADSFRDVYMNTVAMLTSSVSVMQAEVLNTLTDKFIISFDNDSAGERGIETAFRNIRKVNPTAEIEELKVYYDDNDLGNMEEKRDDSLAYNQRYEYYKTSLGILLGGYVR